MDLKEYSSNISEYSPEKSYEPFELQVLMTESRYWSVKFGQMLYDYSTSTLKPQYNQKEINVYLEWVDNVLPGLEKELFGKIDDQKYKSAYQEINFHWLNSAMINSWRPIVNLPNRNIHERICETRLAQDIIAAWCLPYYEMREAMASETAKFSYFADENASLRAVTESRLNEADTAITLLGIMLKNSQLTVLPGPPQYEKYATTISDNQVITENSNSDFLILDDAQQQIIGVQAKARFKDQDFHKYDSRKVILVDGSLDLDNVRLLKTKPRSSNKRLISWNGMLAMDHLKTMPIAGKRRSQLADIIGPKEFQQLRHRAYFQLGDFAVKRSKITNMLEKRISSKLYEI